MSVQASGRFDIVCRNPDGSVAWEEHIPNMAVTAGLNHILGVEFGASTQITTWYAGLINNSGFSALNSADTMGSHAGWSEYTTYSESTRQQWVPGAASGGTISNSSTMNFTVNASSTSVYGIFVASDSTKSGGSGTLWATAAFTSVQSPVSGQVINVTYTVTLTATSP
jgi:hypothetical protein